MKRIAKVMFIALMLLVMPMKQWAQTPYRQYADDGIMLNFFEIDNIDFRLYLLYNLSENDRFHLMADQENGMFILTPESDEEENGFFNEFETFYNTTLADFQLIDKVDLEELVVIWKAGVSPVHFTSITMDIALNRAVNENNHCVDSDPFCTSDVIQFQAATTSQTANQLEGYDFDDGCIGSSYNPSWYHAVHRAVVSFDLWRSRPRSLLHGNRHGNHTHDNTRQDIVRIWSGCDYSGNSSLGCLSKTK